MIEAGILADRTALVTGGARRLGQAVALAFARNGANVVIHYGRSQAEAEETVRAIEALGRRAWAVRSELSAPENAERLFDRAWAETGGIDLLVNNASIFPEGTFETVTLDDLRGNLDVNTFAPLVLSRTFARRVRDDKASGDVVNLLDCRIVEYDHHHVAYHLSKRMLFDLTRICALEFAPEVKVNAIAPGLILPPEGRGEEYLESLAHTNPLQRYGSPSDVANAALFLVTSDFVTGQVIYVDGGRHVKGRMYG